MWRIIDMSDMANPLSISIHLYNFMVTYTISPRIPPWSLNKSFSLCLSSLFRQHCFIIVTTVWAKGQLREQSIHRVPPLLSSCGAGKGQGQAKGISKPQCLLDLSVTFCSHPEKSLSVSFYCSHSLSSLWPSPSILPIPSSRHSSCSQCVRQLPLPFFSGSSFLFVCDST